MTVPDKPTDAEWMTAVSGMIGVEKYYEDIGATAGALEIVRTINKCIRYAAAVTQHKRGE